MYLKYTSVLGYDPQSGTPFKHRPAWRIAWDDPGSDLGYWVHDAAFVRKHDAERALMALMAAKMTDQDLDQMPEGDGPWEHDHIIYEALAW